MGDVIEIDGVAVEDLDVLKQRQKEAVRLSHGPYQHVCPRAITSTWYKNYAHSPLKYYDRHDAAVAPAPWKRPHDSYPFLLSPHVGNIS